MKTCTTCGAYVYDDGASLGSTILGNKHVCPPEWWVWVPEDGEDETDGCMVRGVDPEEAAEKHVEGFDGDSTKQLLGKGFLVHVRDLNRVVKVRVTGEATIDYSTDVEEVTGG